MHLNSRRHFSLFILSIIVTLLLTGCDPLGLPYLSVNRVVIADNIPYLLVLERCSWGIGCSSSQQDRYFTSKDGGDTWQELSSPPIGMPPPLETPGQDQTVDCVPNEPSICYKVTGSEQIEISSDGGKTWQVDWQQPVGRKTYMERDKAFSRLLHVEPDTAPYNIGIIQNPNNYLVIAALGNQGILVKTENGIWHRYPITPSISSTVPDYAMPVGASSILPSPATPIAYSATSLSEIRQSLSLEITRILLISFIFFITLSIFRWRRIRSDNGGLIIGGRKLNRQLMFISGAFLICLLQFVVIFLYPNLPISYIENINLFIGLITIPIVSICLITIFGLLISGLLIANIHRSKENQEHLLRKDIGFSFLLILGTLLPLVLWSINLIHIYEIALIVSLILGTIIIFFAFRKKWLIEKLSNSKSASNIP